MCSSTIYSVQQTVYVESLIVMVMCLQYSINFADSKQGVITIKLTIRWVVAFYSYKWLMNNSRKAWYFCVPQPASLMGAS